MATTTMSVVARRMDPVSRDVVGPIEVRGEELHHRPVHTARETSLEVAIDVAALARRKVVWDDGDVGNVRHAVLVRDSLHTSF